MVSFIKGKHTRFELLGCFHRSKHGVQNLVVEGFLHIKFDNIFSLFLGSLIGKVI